MVYRFYRLFWGLLDLLFPPVCVGCNRAGFRLCPDCQTKFKPVPEPICEICGSPQVFTGTCFHCFSSKPPFVQLRSWTIFAGPVRKTLHGLKYYRNLALGDAVAQPMAQYAQNLKWPVELVVPVPLGKKRQQERGYNQVTLFAMPLANINGWKFAPRALQRTRETRTQVGLSPEERKENMLGAFRANPSLVDGKSICLMDDVATTGATLSACTLALLEAGARQVFALTLARALPHSSLQEV